MSSNIQQSNAVQSVFQKHYEHLPETQKELIYQKYNCSICLDIIKHENPYLCYKCQKIFHHSCLENWDDKQKELNRKLTCPNCRNELPLEQWNVKINYDDNRTKDAEIMNQAGKPFNQDKYIKYINATKKLFHFILYRFYVIRSLITSQKNNKLNNLIGEFSSNANNLSVDEISRVIVEELNLIEQYLTNSKNVMKNEVINHKNAINLIYKCKKEGIQNIFHDYFVSNNKK